tara:strand:+ start:1187 stop:1654 length:468 start_codon:yes stop_codon:yes gene_type:complete
LYKICYDLADELHRGQVRKFTRVPYLTHCTDVARITAMFGGDQIMKCIALLHDSVEDCDITYNYLENVLIEDGIGSINATMIVDGVESLTKRRSFEDTLKTLQYADPKHQHVKCADIIANLSDGMMNERYVAKKAAQLKVMQDSEIKEFALTLCK